MYENILFFFFVVLLIIIFIFYDIIVNEMDDVILFCNVFGKLDLIVMWLFFESYLKRMVVINEIILLRRVSKDVVGCY